MIETATCTTFVALAEDSLVSLDFKDMAPFERGTAGTITRLGTDSITFTLRAAITCIEYVLPVYL